MLRSVVHIVRRFGRVGGMESYVWYLAHGLASKGLAVHIVCEEVLGDHSSSIDILMVKKSIHRRRWKSMLEFRERVRAAISSNFPRGSVIVHSHERSLDHHVSTFHGPPIDSGGRILRLHLLSARVSAWREMERSEILGKSVACVVPVSSFVQNLLSKSHPALSEKKLFLGWPGVTRLSNSALLRHRGKGESSSEIRFGFVGREWSRKGLELTVAIVDLYRALYGEGLLSIYGVEPTDLPKSLKRADWVQAKGWMVDIPWSEIDVLIHPAKNEPFGMVIAEARQFGLPILMSDRVGASDLSFSSCVTVSLNSEVQVWVAELKKLVDTRSFAKSQEIWTWEDLVSLHFSEIYPYAQSYIREFNL